MEELKRKPGRPRKTVEVISPGEPIFVSVVVDGVKEEFRCSRRHETEQHFIFDGVTPQMQMITRYILKASATQLSVTQPIDVFRTFDQVQRAPSLQSHAPTSAPPTQLGPAGAGVAGPSSYNAREEATRILQSKMVGGVPMSTVLGESGSLEVVNVGFMDGPPVE